MTMGTPPSAGAGFESAPPPPGAPGMAPAPAKRKFPTWAIIVIALVALCACGACVLGVITLSSGGGAILGPAMAGAQLPTICIEQSGLDANACGTWAQGVASDPAFSTCVQEGMTSGSVTGQGLYDCLVENGAGPQ